MNKNWKWVAVACGIVVLPACVTINIYFPAAAAEKAADRIIDDVWQLKEKTGGTPASANSPQETK